MNSIIKSLFSKEQIEGNPCFTENICMLSSHNTMIESCRELGCLLVGERLRIFCEANYKHEDPVEAVRAYEACTYKQCDLDRIKNE